MQCPLCPYVEQNNAEGRLKQNFGYHFKLHLSTFICKYDTDLMYQRASEEDKKLIDELRQWVKKDEARVLVTTPASRYLSTTSNSNQVVERLLQMVPSNIREEVKSSSRFQGKVVVLKNYVGRFWVADDLNNDPGPNLDFRGFAVSDR
eukprot:UN07315